MRVTFDVGESMMLSVHCDPLSGLDSRGNPDDSPEDVCNGSSQRQRTMRECSMQIDGRCEVGQKCCCNTRQQPDDDSSHGLTVTRVLRPKRSRREPIWSRISGPRIRDRASRASPPEQSSDTCEYPTCRGRAIEFAACAVASHRSRHLTFWRGSSKPNRRRM